MRIISQVFSPTCASDASQRMSPMRDSCEIARDAQLVPPRRACLREVDEGEETVAAVSIGFWRVVAPSKAMPSTRVLTNLCARCESTRVVKARFVTRSTGCAAFVAAGGLPRRVRAEMRIAVHAFWVSIRD